MLGIRISLGFLAVTVGIASICRELKEIRKVLEKHAPE